MTEGDDLVRRVGDLFTSRDLFAVVPERPDFAGLVVAIDIRAAQLGKTAAGVNIAAGDARSLGMRMRSDGWDDFAGAFGLRFDGLRGLHGAPAVIPAALHEVDHLPQLPTDIAAPQTAFFVEADLPRIAKTEGVDLRHGAGRFHEGIVRRDGIRFAVLLVIDIDAQHAGEQVVQSLAGVARIGRRGHLGIARGAVKHAIRPELERCAVVPAAKPREQHDLGGRIEHRRVVLREFEARELRAVVDFVPERVGDEDEAVFPPLRMKGDAVGVRAVRVFGFQVDEQVLRGCIRLVGEGENLPAILHRRETTRARHGDHFEAVAERDAGERRLRNERLRHLR